jgi:LuxR family maltose regulon positive regulatory protein
MARLALASDDSIRAAYWLAGVTQTRQGITGYDLEDPLLTRARALMATAASEDLGEALAAVERAIEAAEARHVTTSLVQGLTLRALIERSRGEISHAVKSIGRALELAEPGRFIRTFVDLGPSVTGLLAELAGHGALPKWGARVLDVCRAESGARDSDMPSRDLVTPKLAEPLTWRELDVLQLMEGYHTNKEIAQLLGISDETVKKHAASIYSKLEAKGRRDAVTRAHDLGVLRAQAHRMPRSD